MKIYFWLRKNKRETVCGSRSGAVPVLFFNSFHFNFRNSVPSLPTKTMITKLYDLSVNRRVRALPGREGNGNSETTVRGLWEQA